MLVSAIPFVYKYKKGQPLVHFFYLLLSGHKEQVLLFFFLPSTTLFKIVKKPNYLSG